MISDPLDHGSHTAIAHTEAFARHATNIGLPVGRSIKGHIADDDVFLRGKSRTCRGIQYDLSTRKPFGEVVIGIALQFQRHAGWDKRPKTLTSRPLEMKVYGIFRQTVSTVTSGDLTA